MAVAPVDCLQYETVVHPWIAVLLMFFLYVLAIFYFYRNCRYSFDPPSETMLPYDHDLRSLRRRARRLRLSTEERALAELSRDIQPEVHFAITDECLGRGAYGAAFKGIYYEQQDGGMYVEPKTAAFKCGNPSPHAAVEVLNEALTARKLKQCRPKPHPHLVEFFCVSFNDTLRPLYVMEYLDGGSLYAQFKRRRNPAAAPVAKTVLTSHVVRILKQVASAVRFMHEQHGPHGDIAARNVLLTTADMATAIAKLGDFGLTEQPAIANYSGDACKNLPIWWLPMELVDTLETGGARPTTASDAWAFGVLSWECATLGAFPHACRINICEIQKAVRLPGGGLAIPADLNDDLQFILTMLNPVQHERPEFKGSPTPVRGVAEKSVEQRLDKLLHQLSVNAASDSALRPQPHVTHECQCPFHFTEDHNF